MGCYQAKFGGGLGMSGLKSCQPYNHVVLVVALQIKIVSQTLALHHYHHRLVPC
jgi:hypothetical protein